MNGIGTRECHDLSLVNFVIIYDVLDNEVMILAAKLYSIIISY
jgi:hypothetical protein